jgi:hypothetical protein
LPAGAATLATGSLLVGSSPDFLSPHAEIASASGNATAASAIERIGLFMADFLHSRR